MPFRDNLLPGSHLVHKVRVTSCVGVGVVGIQLVVMGGKRTYDLPVRGIALGDGRSSKKTMMMPMRTHAFTIDTPVERLSRLECEQEKNGLIERLRTVTSVGRVSPWFGEKLTPNPRVVVLPDCQRYSFNATLGEAAVGKTGRAEAVTDSFDEGEKTAADKAVKGRENDYITGLFGFHTRDRLVELGVITRRVNDSHVFSYLWEAPEEDERLSRRTNSPERAKRGVASKPSGDENRISSSFRTFFDASSLANATGSRVVPEGDLFGARDSRWDSSGASTASTSSDSSSLDSDSLGTCYASEGPSMSKFSMEERRWRVTRRVKRNAGAVNGNLMSSQAPMLSRAEAKRQNYVQEMREWEKKDQRARHARRAEENIKRLIRGEKLLEEEEVDAEECGKVERNIPQKPLYLLTGEAGRHINPTPQEEFAGVLRIRRVDTRHALKRSIMLAKAVHTYRDKMSSDSSFVEDPHGAISSLPVVMGLTRWLYKALLPELVPLPLQTKESEELFRRGERAISTARATRKSADKMKRMAKRLERRRRRKLPGRGVISPAERAKDHQERKVCVCARTRVCVFEYHKYNCNREGERVVARYKQRNSLILLMFYKEDWRAPKHTAAYRNARSFSLGIAHSRSRPHDTLSSQRTSTRSTCHSVSSCRYSGARRT